MFSAYKIQNYTFYNFKRKYFITRWKILSAIIARMLIYDLSFSCHASSIVLRKKKQILRMNFRSYE